MLDPDVSLDPDGSTEARSVDALFSGETLDPYETGHPHARYMFFSMIVLMMSATCLQALQQFSMRS